MNFLGTLFGIQQQEDDDDSSSDEHKLSEPVEEHVLETTILDTSINQEPTVTEVDNDNIMENNDNDANVPSSNGGDEEEEELKHMSDGDPVEGAPDASTAAHSVTSDIVHDADNEDDHDHHKYYLRSHSPCTTNKASTFFIDTPMTTRLQTRNVKRKKSKSSDGVKINPKKVRRRRKSSPLKDTSPKSKVSPNKLNADNALQEEHDESHDDEYSFISQSDADHNESVHLSDHESDLDTIPENPEEDELDLDDNILSNNPLPIESTEGPMTANLVETQPLIHKEPATVVEETVASFDNKSQPPPSQEEQEADSSQDYFQNSSEISDIAQMETTVEEVNVAEPMFDESKGAAMEEEEETKEEQKQSVVVPEESIAEDVEVTVTTVEEHSEVMVEETEPMSEDTAATTTGVAEEHVENLPVLPLNEEENEGGEVDIVSTKAVAAVSLLSELEGKQSEVAETIEGEEAENEDIAMEECDVETENTPEVEVEEATKEDKEEYEEDGKEINEVEESVASESEDSSQEVEQPSDASVQPETEVSTLNNDDFESIISSEQQQAKSEASLPMSMSAKDTISELSQEIKTPIRNALLAFNKLGSKLVVAAATNEMNEEPAVLSDKEYDLLKSFLERLKPPSPKKDIVVTHEVQTEMAVESEEVQTSSAYLAADESEEKEIPVETVVETVISNLDITYETNPFEIDLTEGDEEVDKVVTPVVPEETSAPSATLLETYDSKPAEGSKRTTSRVKFTFMDNSIDTDKYPSFFEKDDKKTEEVDEHSSKRIKFANTPKILERSVDYDENDKIDNWYARDNLLPTPFKPSGASFDFGTPRPTPRPTYTEKPFHRLPTPYHRANDSSTPGSSSSSRFSFPDTDSKKRSFGDYNQEQDSFGIENNARKRIFFGYDQPPAVSAASISSATTYAGFGLQPSTKIPKVTFPTPVVFPSAVASSHVLAPKISYIPQFKSNIVHFNTSSSVVSNQVNTVVDTSTKAAELSSRSYIERRKLQRFSTPQSTASSAVAKQILDALNTIASPAESDKLHNIPRILPAPGFETKRDSSAAPKRTPDAKNSEPFRVQFDDKHQIKSSIPTFAKPVAKESVPPTGVKDSVSQPKSFFEFPKVDNSSKAQFSKPQETPAAKTLSSVPVTTKPYVATTAPEPKKTSRPVPSTGEFKFGDPLQVTGIPDYNNFQPDNSIQFVFSPPNKPKKTSVIKDTATTSRPALSSSSSSSSKVNADSVKEAPTANIWSLNSINDGKKCPICMVKNKKDAVKCASCESTLVPGATTTSKPTENPTEPPSIWSLSAVNDGVKCSVCMVKNKKGATKCVSCESVLSDAARSSSKNSTSSNTGFGSVTAPTTAASGAINNSGFVFGATSEAFGTKPVEKELKPLVVSTTAKPSAPGFDFGSTTTGFEQMKSGFTFGSGVAATTENKSAFAFESKGGFTFGSNTTTDSKKEESKSDVKSVGFTFGTSGGAIAAPTSSVSGFTFGQKSARSEEEDEGGKRSKRKVEEEEDGEIRTTVQDVKSSAFGSNSTQPFIFGATAAGAASNVPQPAKVTKPAMSFTFGSATEKKDNQPATLNAFSLPSSATTVAPSFAPASVDSKPPVSTSSFVFGASAPTTESATTSSTTAPQPFVFGSNNAFVTPAKSSTPPVEAPDAKKDTAVPLTTSFNFGSSAPTTSAPVTSVPTTINFGSSNSSATTNTAFAPSASFGASTANSFTSSMPSGPAKVTTASTNPTPSFVFGSTSSAPATNEPVKSFGGFGSTITTKADSNPFGVTSTSGPFSTTSGSTSAAPGFSFGTTDNKSFGSAVTTTSTLNAFGSNNASSTGGGFPGLPASTSSSNLAPATPAPAFTFGGPSSSAASNNIFGGGVSTTGGPFSTTASTPANPVTLASTQPLNNPFGGFGGSAAPSSSFPSSSSGMFGSSAPAAANPFTSSTTSSNNPFGSVNTPAPAVGSGGFGFGASTTASQPSSNIFGGATNNNTTTPGANMFGGNNAFNNNPASSNPFGGVPAGPFGAPVAQPLFPGMTPATAVAAPVTPAAGPFGGPASAPFALPAANNPFGAPSGGDMGGAFNMGSASSSQQQQQNTIAGRKKLRAKRAGPQ